MARYAFVIDWTHGSRCSLDTDPPRASQVGLRYKGGRVRDTLAAILGSLDLSDTLDVRFGDAGHGLWRRADLGSTHVLASIRIVPGTGWRSYGNEPPRERHGGPCVGRQRCRHLPEIRWTSTHPLGVERTRFRHYSCSIVFRGIRP